MTYVQYFIKDMFTGKLIEACGDRAVVILDGRHSMGELHAHAQECNGVRRQKYPAYQIFKGAGFLSSTPVSKIITLERLEK